MAAQGPGNPISVIKSGLDYDIDKPSAISIILSCKVIILDLGGSNPGRYWLELQFSHERGP